MVELSDMASTYDDDLDDLAPQALFSILCKISGWATKKDLISMVAANTITSPKWEPGCYAEIAQHHVTEYMGTGGWVLEHLAELVARKVLLLDPGSGCVGHAYRINPDVARWDVPWRKGQRRQAIERVEIIAAREGSVRRRRNVSGSRRGAQTDVAHRVRGAQTTDSSPRTRGANGLRAVVSSPRTRGTNDVSSPRTRGADPGFSPRERGEQFGESPSSSRDRARVTSTEPSSSSSEAEEERRGFQTLVNAIGRKCHNSPAEKFHPRLRALVAAHDLTDLVSTVYLADPVLKVPKLVDHLEEVHAGDSALVERIARETAVAAPPAQGDEWGRAHDEDPVARVHNIRRMMATYKELGVDQVMLDSLQYDLERALDHPLLPAEVRDSLVGAASGAAAGA